MVRSALLSLFAVVLVTVTSSLQAQQPTRVRRIGFLSIPSPRSFSARGEAFRQGLRELGYEEGKNIIVEYRYAKGNFDRLVPLANDMVGLKVELVVTHGAAAIQTLKQATRTLPIVIGVIGDLVASGHAASLARPGGNVTGFDDTRPDLSGKRLEILKKFKPRRHASLWSGMAPFESKCSILRRPRLQPMLLG